MVICGVPPQLRFAPSGEGGDAARGPQARKRDGVGRPLPESIIELMSSEVKRENEEFVKLIFQNVNGEE